MSRRRPFAVEKVRREAELDPAVRLRRLIGQCHVLAARANGAAGGFGRVGEDVERWDREALWRDVANAALPGRARDVVSAREALGLFRSAAQAFAGAGPRDRQVFAPVLLAAGRALEDLMEAAGR